MVFNDNNSGAPHRREVHSVSQRSVSWHTSLLQRLIRPTEELSGTHLDVDRVKAFLLSRGFPPESIFVMKDVDTLPQEQQPTRDNIVRHSSKLTRKYHADFEQMKAVKHLVASPWDPSDRRFFYFSGHGAFSPSPTKALLFRPDIIVIGGQVLDTTHNERDGFDEVIFAAPSPSLSRTSTANLPPSFRVVNALLLPSYKVAIAVPKVTTEFPSTAPPVIPVNAILDDELHEHLVAPVPEGCKLIALVDACHSGSVLDLPFQYSIMSRSGRPKHRGPAASAEHYITNARGAVVRAHQRLSQPTLDRIPLTRALRWGVKRTGDVIEFVGKVLESRPAIAVFDATEALWAQKDVYLRSAMEDEHTSCGTRNHLKCLKEAEEKRVSKGDVVSHLTVLSFI